MDARLTQSALQSALSAPRGDSYIGADGLRHCPRCDTPREVVGKLWGKTVKLPCMCRCEQAEFEAQTKADAERNSGRAEGERLRVARAFQSPGMRSRTFAADDGRYGSEVMRTARAYADLLTGEGTGDGLLFFGPPDSGKTYLSCCIANAALDAGMSVYMRSLPWMLNNKDEWDERELWGCDLLVLDDLGAERSTSYGQEVVYSIIDARYCAGLPMVVSTNLTRRELAAPGDVASARIYGRVLEACLPVEVDTGRRRASADRYAAMKKRLGI